MSQAMQRSLRFGAREEGSKPLQSAVQDRSRSPRHAGPQKRENTPGGQKGANLLLCERNVHKKYIVHQLCLARQIKNDNFPEYSRLCARRRERSVKKRTYRSHREHTHIFGISQYALVCFITSVVVSYDGTGLLSAAKP